MSIKLMSEIWDNEDPGLSGSRLNILLCLADHANDDGVCWPSIPRIAKRVRIDRNNVMDHIKALTKSGYLAVEHRNGTSNVYKVFAKKGSGGSATGGDSTTRGSGGSATPTSGGGTTGGVAVAPPKPSVNHQLEPSVEPSVTPVSQAQPPMLTRKFVSAIDPQLHDEILVALNGYGPTNSPRTEKKERKLRGPKVTSVSPGDANNYHQEMFAALAALCVVDMKLKSGQLGKAAKQLREAGYTPADLDKFKTWWYSQDWRGKNGQPPAINVVSELILQALSWVPQTAWVPPVRAAKPKGYDLSTLRSWHKQHYYEEWNYRVAAELGISPTMPGAFKEWYDGEASIPDDQLADWYEQYLADSKEKQQW